MATVGVQEHDDGSVESRGLVIGGAPELQLELVHGLAGELDLLKESSDPRVEVLLRDHSYLGM